MPSASKSAGWPCTEAAQWEFETRDHGCGHANLEVVSKLAGGKWNDL